MKFGFLNRMRHPRLIVSLILGLTGVANAGVDGFFLIPYYKTSVNEHSVGVDEKNRLEKNGSLLGGSLFEPVEYSGAGSLTPTVQYRFFSSVTNNGVCHDCMISQRFPSLPFRLEDASSQVPKEIWFRLDPYLDADPNTPPKATSDVARVTVSANFYGYAYVVASSSNAAGVRTHAGASLEGFMRTSNLTNEAVLLKPDTTKFGIEMKALSEGSNISEKYSMPFGSTREYDLRPGEYLILAPRIFADIDVGSGIAPSEALVDAGGIDARNGLFVTISAKPIPEPSSLGLLAFGGLILTRWVQLRRRRFGSREVANGCQLT